MAFIWTNDKFQLESANLTIHIKDRNFTPYFALKQFIKEIEHLSSSTDDLLKDLLDNEKNSRAVNAENVIYTVIRRISRESIKTLVLVDQLSRKLAQIISDLNQPIELVIEDIEWIDRLSARVLLQTYRICEKNKFNMTWLFENNHIFNVDAGDNYAEICDLRTHFFENIIKKFNPVKLFSEVGNFSERFDKNKYQSVISDDFLLESSYALVTMNYEHGMLATAQSTESIEKKERIKALIYCNTGDYEKAKVKFLNITQSTNDKFLKIHINYLLGLLEIKRFYNPDAASSFFENSLDILEGIDDCLEKRIEKAWVFNGMSFLEAYNSKLSQNDSFENSFKRESTAFNLIKEDQGKAQAYLKYNLFSNMVFLLEINGFFKDAKNLWEKTFKNHSKEELAGGETGYDAPYLYRHAILSLKDNNTGIEDLKSAYENVLNKNNYIHAIVISYAIGYYAFQNNNDLDAYTYLSKSLKHAIEIGDIDYINYSLVLMSQLDPLEYEEMLIQLVNKNKNYAIDLEEHKSLNVYKPKSKLPSYYPLLDLESEPEKDMNHFLIAGGKK